MKTIRLLRLLGFLFGCFAFLHSGDAQSKYLDSLLNVLETEKDQLELLKTYTRIGHYYQDNSNPRAIDFYKEALALSEELNIPVRVANNHYSIGLSCDIKSEYDIALDHYLKSARIYEEIKDSFRLSNALLAIAGIYNRNNDFEKTEEYHDRVQSIAEEIRDTLLLADVLNNRGIIKDKQGKFDEALAYYKMAVDLSSAVNNSGLKMYSLSNIGLTYKRQGRPADALPVFNSVLELIKQSDYPPHVYASIYNNLGSTYLELNKYDEARISLEKSVDYANEANASSILMESYKKMAELNGRQKKFEEKVIYLEKYYNLKDSIFSVDSKNTIVQLEADYQIERKNSELLQQEAELARQRNERNLLLIFAASVLLIVLALVFAYQRIRKSKALLEEKNVLINQQNEQLGKTLNNLKSTQAKLIQSEKMASLGELTAGIAHEIQNPLNFVNNFSEVSDEILDEMIEEIENGDLEEVKAIASDIKQNLQKITHHGKRADAIVKGMLQHSRQSTGEAILTDINKLADEYLRLAYHGLRAKDKTFNAILETDFDPTLEKIKVVPQDLGRVLLNLITNAFYVVNEKNNDSADSYQPTVKVNTRKGADHILITVEDNGNGIPQSVRDKIFQPFFTTKPTGQGTGLGLSLSYDIVKAHGGELEVETKEGSHTIFKIILPNKKK